MDPKQLKIDQTSLLFQKVTVEFYSSWFDNHNLITRKSFTLKRTKQIRNYIYHVEVQE